jgi:hypothetical protein
MARGRTNPRGRRSAALRAAALAWCGVSTGSACDFQYDIDPYTQYFGLNPDYSAYSPDDCLANCCADPSCDVWQYTDMPMGGVANCMHGVSYDYGDSGGIVWSGGEGRQDKPSCDLSACECDGVSLSSLRGKTHHAPADAEGYAYMLSVCGEIPKDELPSGCQQYAEHPAVVKYKGDNPADCIEIGSVGPCSQGECGVTGTAQPHGGLELVYTYTYGCKNTFSLMMTPGTDSEPGQILSDECSYSGAWAGLADGMDQYRCEHDRCVKSGRHLPGVEKAACETICGEPPRCVAALDRLCGDTQDQTSCEFCAGSHDIQLALAGCKHEEISTFCAATDQ